MLQLRSVCDVADNTGAKRAAIIHVLGEAKRYGEVGDVVKAHAPTAMMRRGSIDFTGTLFVVLSHWVSFTALMP